MNQQSYIARNGEAASPLLLLAEHAGREIPSSYNLLGLNPADFQSARNLLGDVGTGNIARLVAEKTNAPSIAGLYSRLLIDLNRLEDSPELIVSKAHGFTIPDNVNITALEKEKRLNLYHRPFHERVEQEIERRLKSGRRPTLFSIHSFTPSIGLAQAEDQTRPAPDIGLLYVEESPLLHALRKTLAQHSQLQSADNFPYDLHRVPPGSIHRHGIARGLPSLAIEISIDKIQTPTDELFWATLLTEACLNAFG